MDRRRFLSIGAVLSVGITTSGLRFWPDSSAEPEALAHPQLLSVLDNPARIRELGRRYRSQVPAEGSQDALIAALRADLGSAPPAATEKAVEQQVREDFARGHIIRLNGWVLSRTEARQCALFSLS